MGFKTLLQEHNWYGRSRVTVPEPYNLQKLVRLLEALEVSQRAERENVADMQMRIMQEIDRHGISSLSRKDLRDICRVFFLPPRPPGREPELRDGIISAVWQLKRKPALYGLLDSYMDIAKTGDEDARILGRRLREILTQIEHESSVVWKKRDKDFAIFDMDRAPREIAKVILDGNREPSIVLSDAGLDNPHRQKGGLAITAFTEACRIAMKSKRENAVRLQKILSDWAHLHGEKFSYPEVWTEYSAALLSPWDSVRPEEEHKRWITERLLNVAGDPRTNPAQWRGLKERHAMAYGVILRWLTQDSFRQFFDIVTKMTDRLDMWEARRIFWTKYLNAEHISEAWVVFGEEGARLAKEAASRSDDKALLNFGKHNERRGRTSRHTALLMRIGDITIAEWSHNGAWNMWRRGSNTPVLYKKFYEADELMEGDERCVHNGDWERKIRHIILHETGERI